MIPENAKLLADMGVMSEREIMANYEIRMEQYVANLGVEFRTYAMMMHEGVLPAISKHIAREGAAMGYLQDMQLSSWKNELAELVGLKIGILEDLDKLTAVQAKTASMSAPEAAYCLTREALPISRSIRAKSDRAETLVARDLWPYPTYHDLLVIDGAERKD